LSDFDKLWHSDAVRPLSFLLCCRNGKNLQNFLSVVLVRCVVECSVATWPGDWLFNAQQTQLVLTAAVGAVDMLCVYHSAVVGCAQSFSSAAATADAHSELCCTQLELDVTLSAVQPAHCTC